jgi:carbon monoxide dehydrogenase subunit G
MEVIHKSIDIDDAPDRVFAYVADPSTGTEWLPSLMDIRNVSGTGVGQHYEWTYKMVGFPLHGETSVVAHVPSERRVVRMKGTVESLWTFVLEPRERGTHLDVTVEYSVPLPVLGKLAEKLVVRRNDREIEVALQSIKDHCEG